ncbi:MSCRAMM family adhesin SdrC [Lentzea alba]|uniref:hypothetical protein n=1 Tax=Lentzea alba TaxID=2714351 RepID=UPI0039BEF8B1
MKKLCAVTLTAAIVLPAVGVPAAAQDDKITVEGLVWLDRNGDKKQDSFESVLGNWRGVKVEKVGTGEVVGEFPTDANGRYRAELPVGQYVVTVLTNGEYSPTTPLNRTVESTGTADFGIRGGSVAGRSFLDKNKDGVRQSDEELLSPGTLNGKQIPVSREDGQFSVEDLPYGKYKFVAADYTKRGLALVEPKGTDPIDWATGTLEFTLGELEGPGPLDAVYFEPKGDGALEGTTISPAKDTYAVGEQITVRFQLLNKGDVPGKMSVVVFGLGSADAKLISLSDNVTGTMQDFETVAKIMPGKSITVEMKLELTSTELTEISPFARPFIGGFKDVDHKNQGQSFYRKIKVVAKGTTTEPTTSPSETTTPTATTTTPVVAQAGSKSGLASTGASPLGFLAIGSLLLAAGLGAFFVARRRRS